MNTTKPGLARRALPIGIGLLGLLIGAELVCRYALGLGTPPLYEAHPQLEYRLVPSQELQRFGNRISVNRWGMRAADFEATKASPDELRVLVMGDSIVNGGSQIDQSELSTSLLQVSLHKALGRPVTVGNASAGSWGPGNWLAHARLFGFLDADVVVLVLGSGDHADNPLFRPLDVDHPTEPPVLALQEAVQRYLPRFLPMAWRPIPSDQPSPSADPVADSARGLADLEAFLRLAQADGRRVIVFHHPDRDELVKGFYLPGFNEERALLQRLRLPLIELRMAYASEGEALYRDGVHHNARGQQVLAQALHGAVLEAVAPTRPVLQSPLASPSTASP